MKALTAHDILALWDRAASLEAGPRALALITAAEPATAVHDLACLPVGRRDALLLDLYETLSAGGTLDALADCQECGECMEFTTTCAVLRTPEAGPEPRPVEVDGYVVTWRPVDSRDLQALPDDTDVAEQLLLDRCVSRAVGPDGEARGSALPDTVRQAVADAMAASDPQADVGVALTCPACGTLGEHPLDIAEMLWSRIRTRAHQLLVEVDTLARAYGWSEPEILALGEHRRAAYLALVAP
jgi:hypothetical protein